MASTSTARKSPNVEEDVNMIVTTNFDEPKYKLHPEVALKIDLVGAFSSIPPSVLLVKDVSSYIHCKIGEVGDFETIVVFQQLCGKDGKLKPEYNQIEKIGFSCAIHFLQKFKIERIRIVLSQYHNGKFWSDKPVVVTKKMLSRVIGYPTTDKAKAF